MPSFEVNDLRGSSSPRGRAMQAEIDRMRKQGMTLPTSDRRAAQTIAQLGNSLADGSGQRAIRRAVSPSVNNAHIDQSRRKGFGKLAYAGGGDMAVAFDKQREPLQSMMQKGIPFDTSDPDELSKIRLWCRSYYATHYLIPLMIDIYSRFPIQGMEIDVKDPQLKEFYEQLFFDELNYEQFLLDFGQEYFTVGEANSLANFNEVLGVWDSEELINPEDIIVQRSPFLKNPRYKLRVPEMIRNIIETQEPRIDYELLVQQYPEFLTLMRSVDDEDDGMDISNILLSRTINKASPWDVRGTPHMLRCFSVLISEESLNAAQDAIADRLYSPLVMAKLGSPDLGDGAPWIPDAEELENFKNDMQMALAADFRFMAYHFGVEVENVFGREQMPRLGDDYDRIERKLLQVWGIGEALISGGSSQAAYASTALNREFVTQMMSSYQKQLKQHFRQRAEVVAEAQEHFDYKTSNGVRVPEYEEVLMVDEDTGEEYIRKRPKLLIPELSFKTMNLRDEQQERAFMQQLKQNGVPVSDQAMMINVPIEFGDEIEKIKEEKVQKIVADAEAQESAVKAIIGRQLPLSPELQLVKQQMDAAKQGYQAPQQMGNGAPPQGGGQQQPGQQPAQVNLPSMQKGQAGGGGAPANPDQQGTPMQTPTPAAGGGRGGGGGMGGGMGGGGMGSGGAALEQAAQQDPNSPQAQIMQQMQADQLTQMQENPSPPINDIGTNTVNINSQPPGAGGMGRGKGQGGGAGAGGAGGGGGGLPRNQIRQRPSISDEQRGGMPKATSRAPLNDGPWHVGKRAKLDWDDVQDAVTERKWTRSLGSVQEAQERLREAQEGLDDGDH